MKNQDIQFLMIDLFCGAGGTTTGAEMSDVCKVIAAINHDATAISSHAANHENVFHITEDILIADLQQLIKVVAYWKARYPKAKLILWASLECTNFSNAKGGLPRDADSRSLAHGMFRYLKALDPDYFLIENVREFMAWGDLDEKGKPVSKTNGREYIRWIKQVQSYGYQHDWRLLNAANFGGVTIRERYFGAFYKPGLPFAWPQRTHAKRAAKGNMFKDEMKPWRAVAEVLDFSDLGKSIFGRKKPLVDKTLRRILAGLQKFHTQPLMMMCNTPGYCAPVEQPIGALTTINSKALLIPMLQSYYGGTKGCSSANAPAPTVTTKDRLALVTPWIDAQFGKSKGNAISDPAGTITVNPKLALCTAWIDRNFRTGRYQTINEPAGAVLTVPKINLCTAFLVPSSFDNAARSITEPAPTILASRKHVNIASAFLINPQYRNKGNAVTDPAPTVIASQKSFPLSLATATDEGEPKWTITSADSQAMIDLKNFMRENGIADIYMRMLMVKELKLIQGFPEDYVLHGKLNDQKKFIGNSVETGIVNKWLRAIAAESSNDHQIRNRQSARIAV
jgi:DNA (cytosine-5)-methyltransferase 1